MKQGREHRVPLTTAMMSALQRTEVLKDESGLISPPSRGGAMLSDATQTKVFKALNIPATIHGLRSTFRDWAAETSVDHVTAEQCLAYAAGSATERAYRRSDLLQRRREVMTAWSRVIGTEEPF